MPIQTVAIVGVGLIGGSFALALRASGFSGRILGVSSPRTLDAALKRDVIDEGLPIAEAVPQADLVYLSQPISRIIDILARVSELAKPSALVTDAGSTKAQIVEEAARHFTEKPWFLGGHPMAGKEKRGVDLADAGLFQGATYLLTPAGGKLPEAAIIDEFVRCLEAIGSRVSVMPPDHHDRTVAWTSHLPQLISTALAASIADNLDRQDSGSVAGPALRDMTRLGESSFEIWRDILETNRTNVGQVLDLYIQRLQQVRRDAGGALTKDEFEKAKMFRNGL
jgi:prephenate dehydrogenase